MLVARVRVLRVANGRLDTLNNRGLWRQTAGCNALIIKCLWRECWVEVAAKDFKDFMGSKAGK